MALPAVPHANPISGPSGSATATTGSLSPPAGGDSRYYNQVIAQKTWPLTSSSFWSILTQVATIVGSADKTAFPA
ncbi:MAG: hypothetical protein MUC60_06690 [Oscillatoria sp. Prado101]|nr:hypothetical protein [Oscillatoria sp. Prado101]